MVGGLVYLDASAIVRLVVEEPGWEAVVGYLRDHPTRVTSALSTTEVIRATRRAGASTERLARAKAVLGRVDQVSLGPDLLRRAGELEPASLRNLDAIHLATALDLGPLEGFVTYDARLGEAARQYGLRVETPG